jgi:very-short-patch-repair endonuclease
MANAHRFATEISAVVAEAATMIDAPAEADDAGLDEMTEWLDLVSDSPTVPAKWLDDTPEKAHAALQRYRAERSDYDSDREAMLSRYQDEVFETDIDDLAERFLGEYERFWKRWFNKSYASDVDQVLKHRLESHRKAVYKELRHELDVLRATKRRRRAWESMDHELHTAFGGLFKGVSTSPDDLERALLWFRRFSKRRGVAVISDVVAATLTNPATAPRTLAATLVFRLQESRSGFASSAAQLRELFHDLPSDLRSCAPYLKAKLDAMEEAPRYCQYRKWISELRARGLGKLLDAIRDDRDLSPDDWRTTFDRVMDASLIDYSHRNRANLGAFDREAHDRLRQRYATIDQGNVSSGGQRVVRRIEERSLSGMADAAYSQAINIIMREAGKSRNVMAIRTLARRAFDAIRVLKPCWMMSPLAVSQYLPPGQVFDIVVFDEASQMRPADAIPALSRGRQVVVVGDDKQLPPTSFFDNAITLDEDENAEHERGDISDYESILDRCKTVLQQRMLRWHYRSRDEALIAFSNQHFYDGRLVTFPVPARQVGLGVRLVKVESSYSRGGTRQNRQEAIEVARLAYEHARTRSESTLGIIAFSQAQQRAIEDALERAAEIDPETAEFFADSRPVAERVFVKNLESVQGDERDVIILSVGYGRDENGKLSYNFGPLNRVGGGRRLNVAVTRAKSEMVVVSSIDDHDLDSEKCREGGPFFLRSYLAYARAGGSLGGTIHATGRGVDSPFEEDVRLVLADLGHKVHLQVGASGYRIDLAVCHPQREGEYTLAVECDGATYHGTPTARDRDRLRDRTLRSFGWRIHRIWSRDWFRRRAQEIERLQAAVAAALDESNVDAPGPGMEEPASNGKVTQEEADPRERLLDTAADAVYRFLDSVATERAKREIAQGTSLPEPLVGTVLDMLIGEHVVARSGAGRGTKYRRCRRRA